MKLNVHDYINLVMQTEGVALWRAHYDIDRLHILLKDGTTWWTHDGKLWFFMGFWDMAAPGRWYVKEI